MCATERTCCARGQPAASSASSTSSTDVPADEDRHGDLELGRNIVRCQGSGQVVVRSLTSPMRAIEIVAQDNRPGITNLTEILSGKYRSRHGMGAGLRRHEGAHGCVRRQDGARRS